MTSRFSRAGRLYWRLPSIVGAYNSETAMSLTRARPQVMKLTATAAERIRAIMAEKGAATAGLRIGIKKGGCAGMEYTMEWASEQKPHDEVVEENGAKVLIDPKAVMYLLGTEMDYRSDKLSSQFVFTNPNQKGSCGCGESVNLAPVAADKLDALRG
jgi:iron-sulfur cluster assembly protein